MQTSALKYVLPPFNPIVVVFNEINNEFSPFFFHNSSQNEGNKLLKGLSKINKPLEIKFKEMLNLMKQCEVVEKQNNHNIQTRSNDQEEEETFMNRQYPLFSGIVPGM